MPDASASSGRAPSEVLRVALVSEGTYPYAMGGVSTWCEQLIRGFPEYRWEMVALSVNGREHEVFERPDNLHAVRSIPLWTPMPARDRRVRPGRAFLSSYRALIEAMLESDAPRSDGAAVARSRFLLALRGLYEYAAGGKDLPAALASNAALAQMIEAWRQTRADRLSLAEAIDATWLLAHLLRPLVAPPVNCDLVHASMNGPCMLVAMAAKWRYGTPVLLSEHGIYLRERYLALLEADQPYAVKVLILGFHRALAGAGYLVADAIAPHSAHNRRWQLENGADSRRMWTMYNGVDPSAYPVVTTEPDQPTIVFMGRITPIKDIHTLIRAFARVRAALPAARLRIFGAVRAADAAYAASCRRLIDELDLRPYVEMAGPSPSAVAAFHAASIVALTSISEGFPYSVIEAMACGRPVVATDVGGVSEAIGDAGAVVAAGDHEAFAAACVRILRDPQLHQKMAQLARTRMVSLFSLDQCLDSYRVVYDRLTGRRTPPRRAADAPAPPPPPPPPPTSGRIVSPARSPLARGRIRIVRDRAAFSEGERLAPDRTLARVGPST